MFSYDWVSIRSNYIQIWWIWAVYRHYLAYLINKMIEKGLKHTYIGHILVVNAQNNKNLSAHAPSSASALFTELTTTARSVRLPKPQNVPILRLYGLFSIPTYILDRYELDWRCRTSTPTTVSEKWSKSDNAMSARAKSELSQQGYRVMFLFVSELLQECIMRPVLIRQWIYCPQRWCISVSCQEGDMMRIWAIMKGFECITATG